MATRTLRRGLPRVPGGEPWPPGLAVDSGDGVSDADVPAAAAPAAAVPAAAAPASSGADTPLEGSPVQERSTSGVPAPVLDGATAPRSTSVRRGLPRVPGGEPWPPADAMPRGAVPEGVVPGTTGADPAVATAAVAGAAPAAAGAGLSGVAAPSTSGGDTPPEGSSAPQHPTSGVSAPALGGATAETAASVRRGLPRTPGGEPWPPADTVVAERVSSRSASPSSLDDRGDAALASLDERGDAAPLDERGDAAPLVDATAVATRAVPALGDPSIPLPAPRTVWNGSAPRHVTSTAPASDRPRPTWTQAIAGLLGAAALGILAAAAVAFVRALLSFPFMQDFLAAFPGEYEPAVAVEPGFAPWVNWAHFFNVFLMVLIIRSGLRIRNEKRPTAFWTPRNDPKGKVSLTIWFHQALDILWLVNGVIFVVLLFVTGHWARIVPTSWEVIPNALSAALQYVSFDWPTEHGWVNYNSLQQLAYFVTVFIAAPLAAATGFRMSGMWPKKAERLSKAYPIEWARALHFPVMIYFVVFIIGHVALVFLTGFLRNLNHMYASSDAVGWTGFWVFVASLGVIALGWVAARPLVIAPIAKLFGSVSGR
ncbi:cytochrome b/b6 domain-containing protein [Microbacterium sp. K2]|uniref:cytochrome b/b6 domain-containing protein n=1 Tax=Microbacterium sp. K2 TaxID=3391827 RepID=UPI003ED94CC4